MILEQSGAEQTHLANDELSKRPGEMRRRRRSRPRKKTLELFLFALPSEEERRRGEMGGAGPLVCNEARQEPHDAELWPPLPGLSSLPGAVVIGCARVALFREPYLDSESVSPDNGLRAFENFTANRSSALLRSR